MSPSQQYPQTAEDFNRVTGEFQETEAYRAPLLFSVGGRVVTKNGTLASVRYPVVNGPGQNAGTAAILMKVLGITAEGVQNAVISSEQIAEILRYYAPFRNDGKYHANIEALKGASNTSEGVIASFIFEDVAPQGVEDSTLKFT